MGTTDWLQLVIEILALAGFGLGAANRWAVANHRDRLAMFTSAAANAAGRINLALAGLPPDADRDATRMALTRAAAAELLREFDATGPKIAATAAKAEAMIEARIGLPAPPAFP